MKHITMIIGSILLAGLMFVSAKAQRDKERNDKYSCTFFKSRAQYILMSRG